MTLPLDYETLRVIWWLLMGVLLIGFALTDGFDLGVASLLPWVAKTDEERRMVINTVGATWEGNQVWFILGGGAIFAAWPFVYAVSFSGFYPATGRVQISLEAAGSQVARTLGLGAVRRRVCPCFGVRRRGRQRPARAALPPR